MSGLTLEEYAMQKRKYQDMRSDGSYRDQRRRNARAPRLCKSQTGAIDAIHRAGIGVGSWRRPSIEPSTGGRGLTPDGLLLPFGPANPPGRGNVHGTAWLSTS